MQFVALLALTCAQIQYGNQTQIINGRQVIASTVTRGGNNPQPGIGPGWHTMNAYRPGYFNPQLGKLLSDIESQLEPNHGYRDNDKTIWAHEATHGINSRARQSLPERYNAFYCFKGKCFCIPEPRVTKRMVGQYVPQQLRSQLKSFDLYVHEPPPPPGYATWEDCPLHLIDEYTAYLNGLEVSQELNLRVQPDGDLWHAVEFAVYASALLRCVQQHDSTYQCTPQLVDYLNYCLARTGHYLPSTPNTRIKSLAHAVKQIYGGSSYANTTGATAGNYGNFVGSVIGR